MQKLVILLIVVFLSFPVIAKEHKDNKGHGAGGVREDHASEMGMEKGKAWAGTKEKQSQETSEEGESLEIEDSEKSQKDKKIKKEKKSK